MQFSIVLKFSWNLLVSFASLCEWLRKLTLYSQQIRCKGETYRYMFPLLSPFASFEFEFSLAPKHSQVTLRS